MGSGSLPVLGTPRLLAWCEAATCAAIDPTLPEGSTSVGTRVELEHRAASPVGAEVRVTASASYVDGRLHRFTVVAHHTVAGTEKVIGTGRDHPPRRRLRQVPRSPLTCARDSPVRKCPPGPLGGDYVGDYANFVHRHPSWESGGSRQTFEEDTMGKTGRKRRARKKKAANHGKRPNA